MPQPYQSNPPLGVMSELGGLGDQLVQSAEDQNEELRKRALQAKLMQQQSGASMNPISNSASQMIFGVSGSNV